MKINTKDTQKSFSDLSLSKRRSVLRTCNPLERQFLLENLQKSSDANFSRFSKSDTLTNRIIVIIDNEGLKSPTLYFYPSPLKKIRQLFFQFLDFFYIVFKGGLSFQSADKKMLELSLKKTQSLDKAVILKPKISQESLLKLLSTMKENKNKDLASELEKQGYELIIEDMEFEEEAVIFSDINITGLYFKGCTFSEVFYSSSQIENTEFEQCEFWVVSFSEATLRQVEFKDCSFQQINFWKTRFINTAFQKSDLISSCFEESDLDSITFCDSKLPGTFFLQPRIKNLTVENSSLRDTVFFDIPAEKIKLDEVSRKTFNQVTKPLVLILTHPEKKLITTPKVLVQLEKSEIIPIPIHFEPFNLEDLLNDRISKLLSGLSETKSDIPMPQRLLAELKKEKNAKLQLILDKMRIVKSYIQGVALPGGENIPQKLFADKSEHDTQLENYARSILEIAIIEMTQTSGIPLLTLCRGFQMMSIYQGGKLSDLPHPNKGIFSINPRLDAQDETTLSIFQRSFKAPFAHYQGVSNPDFPDKNLRPLADKDEIVVAAESNWGGAAFNLNLQFHPEFLCDDTAFSYIRGIIDLYTKNSMSKEENSKIWQSFNQAILTYQKKQCVIKTLSIFKQIAIAD